MQAPHVEKRITIITIDDNATDDDSCIVEDAQQMLVCHSSELPNGEAEISNENVAHPPQPVLADPMWIPEVNARKQEQDLSSSPLFTLIESLVVPQLGDPSRPLIKPAAGLPLRVIALVAAQAKKRRLSKSPQKVLT